MAAAAASIEPTASRLRCVALTASGSRCRHWVVNRGNKCAFHLAKQDGLVIDESNIPASGLGLFTAVERKAGERVVPYDGARVKFLGRKPSEAFGGSYVLQITAATFIDAESHASGAGRFINMCRPENAKLLKRSQHSLNNCHFEWDEAEERAWVVATEAIPAGSELLVDYGEQYFPQTEQKQQPKSPAKRRASSMQGSRRASLTTSARSPAKARSPRGQGVKRASLRPRRSLSAKV
jgi:hypothetical protein